MTPRFHSLMILVLIAALSTNMACRDDEDPAEADVGVDADLTDSATDGEPDANDGEHPLAGVDESESWEMADLSGEVHVVRTEGNIPHIYAENDLDAARVHGFVAARDRYFMMDLARRLGLGEISSLLGDAGLETDIESRLTGSRQVAQRIADSASPEVRAAMEAYAEGINYYIEKANAGEVPYPSEVELAYQLLGLDSQADMLTPFDVRDVAGMLATFIYQTSFETGAIRRQASYDQLETLFEGDRFQDLRRAGAWDDIWNSPHPLFDHASGEWGPHDDLPSTNLIPTPGPAKGAPYVESNLVERLGSSLDLQHEMRGWRNDEKVFGSNAWAVSGEHTTDGSSLMAADGHLSLGIPSILYNVGINTELLGEEDGDNLLGLVIPGIPFIALGTNGEVAWSFTQLFGDVTDWYIEELELDADGAPSATYFEDEWHDLEAIEEVYDVANVVVLQSTGRVEELTRYQTFDGRWILDIEGETVEPDAEVEAGQTIVRTHSGYVIPGDTDDDGKITAISFAYAGLQMDDLMGTFQKLGESKDVIEFRAATKGMLASSFNFVASDSGGNIFYNAFQGTPCRTYLPRDGDGMWQEGANPTLLLDGTIYGSFIIPSNDDGRVDDSHQNDPYRCVVPFDESPQAYNPEEGYVLTANHDPAGIAFDSNLHNDPWYIGGPWYPGFRADTIERYLTSYVSDQSASIETMAELQQNTESALGRHFTGHLLDAIDHAEDITVATPIIFEDWEQRLFDDYGARRDEIQEVRTRLQNWADRGYNAHSGVDTFYSTPTAEDRDDAVATMIYNAYFGALVGLVFDDEGIPGIWQRGGTAGRIRLLSEMLTSRETNVAGLSSFNPDTGESVFFDNKNTDITENSDELMIRALIQALDFLESESNGDTGGFETDDMDQWLWGLRHQVVFESLLAGFLGDQPGLAALVSDFAINTDRLPLAEDMEENDPRQDLKWFPRDGDQYAVDAANPGLSGTRFKYSSGPVMRMVVALKDGEVVGQNVIPGGQSGLTDSPFFEDQAALWLGNETYPMRYTVEEVLEGAIGREVFRP